MRLPILFFLLLYTYEIKAQDTLTYKGLVLTKAFKMSSGPNLGLEEECCNLNDDFFVPVKKTIDFYAAIRKGIYFTSAYDSDLPSFIPYFGDNMCCTEIKNTNQTTTPKLKNIIRLPTSSFWKKYNYGENLGFYLFEIEFKYIPHKLSASMESYGINVINIRAKNKKKHFIHYSSVPSFFITEIIDIKPIVIEKKHFKRISKYCF